MKAFTAWKKILSLLLTLSILLTAGIVLADASPIDGTGTAGGDEAALLERLRVITDFKFRLHEKGIGYGLCPVYSRNTREKWLSEEKHRYSAISTQLNSVYCNSVRAVSMRLRRMYSETATPVSRLNRIDR